MDLSLLLLVTPMNPPTPPVSGVPRPPTPGIGAVMGVAPDPARPVIGPRDPVGPVVGAVGDGAVGDGEDGVDSRPVVLPVRCVLKVTAPGWLVPPPGGAEIPAVPWAPTGISWKSSLVIGSLYFLRRKRWSTRTLTFGGKAFPFLREKSAMAWTYCWPRNTSSSSFSRCDACFQTGMATVMRTAMTPIATSRATMAYPLRPPVVPVA